MKIVDYRDYNGAEVNKQMGYLLISFFVWPFATFIYSLFHYNRKESRVIFILFTALYGYAMIANSEGFDLYRYLLLLEDYVTIPTKDFFKIFQGEYKIMGSSGGAVDIYRDVVAFLVSRFTDSGSILMLVFGSVYGYVYAKSLTLFLAVNSNKNCYTAVLLVCFSCFFGLHLLAGVRFATGAYVFFYGINRLFITQNKVYWFIIFLSALFHFGFLMGIALLFIFQFIKKSDKVIYLLLIASLILPNILYGIISQFSNLLAGGFASRAEIYSNENYLEIVKENIEGTNWYIKYAIEIIKIYIYAAIIIIKFKKNKLYVSNLNHHIYIWTLFILTFVNFTVDVPSLGERYMNIVFMFFFFFLYKLYSDNKHLVCLKYLILFALPACSLHIIYVIRSILNYTTPYLYLGNILFVLTDNSNESVWEFIK